MGCGLRAQQGLAWLFTTEIVEETDNERGFALGWESAAAGSRFGQYVVARCYSAGYLFHGTSLSVALNTYSQLHNVEHSVCFHS
jgi:hypothetical protein